MDKKTSGDILQMVQENVKYLSTQMVGQCVKA